MHEHRRPFLVQRIKGLSINHELEEAPTFLVKTNSSHPLESLEAATASPQSTGSPESWATASILKGGQEPQKSHDTDECEFSQPTQAAAPPLATGTEAQCLEIPVHPQTPPCM